MTYTIYDQQSRVVEDYHHLNQLVANQLIKDLAIKHWGVNYDYYYRNNRIVVSKKNEFYYAMIDTDNAEVNTKYNRLIVV